jgi:pSer/pThr/pTyr-binding forkhead associated (FHA) protein
MAKLQLILSEDSQPHYELTEEKTTIGRVEDNSLQIDDISISSHHAEIVSDGTIFHLHDLNSTNGTFVNGEQITDAVLNPNDEIRFGAINAMFLTDGIILTDAQPLPASAAPAIEMANQSARPANFLSSSPIPRNIKKKDPVALAAMVLGIVGLLTAGAAAAMAFLA